MVPLDSECVQGSVDQDLEAAIEAAVQEASVTGRPEFIGGSMESEYPSKTVLSFQKSASRLILIFLVRGSQRKDTF